MMKRELVSESSGAKWGLRGNHLIKYALKQGANQHFRAFCMATVDFRKAGHSIDLAIST